MRGGSGDHTKTCREWRHWCLGMRRSLNAIALCLRVLLEGLNDVQICHCSPPFRWATTPFRSRMLTALPW